MSPISENNNPQDQVESYKVPTIGIIYPPPELRNIVDKTAGFVARNGPDFEARIRQNEINNAKFNFLNPGDPYHPYYEHKVKELREGKTSEDSAPATPAAPQSAQAAAQQQAKAASAGGAPGATHQQNASKPGQEIVPKIIQEPKKVVPKEPPKEYEFIVDPPSISAIELDIVKLTAQFVARNGKNFQTNLMNREQRNFQFDFLRPQHSLFPYFRKLVEQYTKILIPDNGLDRELEVRSRDSEKVLDDVRYRVEWLKLQESERRKREENEERERIQYSQIDWHDFTIVETVDYMPHEQGNFPPPTTPQEVGTRALLQQRLESDEIDVEMEVDSDEETAGADKPAEETAKKLPSEESAVQKQQQQQKQAAAAGGGDSAGVEPFAPPLPPSEKVVVKNFNPQQKAAAAASAQKFLISPITGERVPADKMEEHMRIGLLDPRWVEQRDKQMQEKMAQEEVFAQGSSIESSLRNFAERRTDIFGQEETAIGMRVGEEEERQPDKPIWDGHSSTADSVARQARANITVEQQIQQIHKMKGLVGDAEKEKIGPAKPSQGGDHQRRHDGPPSRPPQPPQMHHHQRGGGHHPQAVPPPVRPPPPPQMRPAAGGILPPGVGHAPPPPQMLLPPHRPPVMMGGVPPPLMMPGGHHHPGVPPLPFPPGGPAGGGILPPAFMMGGGAPVPPPPVPPPPPQQRMDGGSGGIDDGGPSSAKKAKTEDQLIPEDEFLRSQPSDAIAVRVAVPPLADNTKADWRMAGQTATLPGVPLRETFGALKSRIQDLTGMPPGKQKLVFDGMFVKDNNSLAFYNVHNNGVVQLQLKERGGRKK